MIHYLNVKINWQLADKIMHSFEVHSNERACRKSGRLAMEQVNGVQRMARENTTKALVWFLVQIRVVFKFRFYSWIRWYLNNHLSSSQNIQVHYLWHCQWSIIYEQQNFRKYIIGWCSGLFNIYHCRWWLGASLDYHSRNFFNVLLGIH